MSPRQAEHALGDDVAQDLVGAAGDAQCPATRSSIAWNLPATSASSGPLSMPATPCRSIAKVAMSCSFGPRPACRSSSPVPGARPATAPSSCDAGVLQAAGLHRPVRELRAHRAFVDRRAVFQLRLRAELEQLRKAGRRRRRRSRGARSSAWSATPSSPRRPRRGAGASGIFTSVKNTSLKSGLAVDLLDRPDLDAGLFMSRKNMVRPLCLGTLGSVRVTRMP